MPWCTQFVSEVVLCVSFSLVLHVPHPLVVCLFAVPTHRCVPSVFTCLHGLPLFLPVCCHGDGCSCHLLHYARLSSFALFSVFVSCGLPPHSFFVISFSVRNGLSLSPMSSSHQPSSHHCFVLFCGENTQRVWVELSREHPHTANPSLFVHAFSFYSSLSHPLCVRSHSSLLCLSVYVPLFLSLFVLTECPHHITRRSAARFWRGRHSSANLEHSCTHQFSSNFATRRS